MTTIYQVWDHDPMDGSMGRDYLAATYRKRADADADVARRNTASRRRFEREATNGRARAVTEPWNWQQARVVESSLK